LADKPTWLETPSTSGVYLFNPFTGDVLTAVQRQIHRSLLDQPRKLTLFYMNPLNDDDTFLGLPWLGKQRELPTGIWDGVRFVVYESCIASPVLDQSPTVAT